MKITFVIPFLHLFGGIRRVCQYANSMQRRGHQVTVTYPLVPMKFGAEWCDLDRLYQQAFSALGNLKKGNRISWFPLETPLQRAMYFPERCKIPLWYGSIPDADIVVATAWPTAYLVHHLGKEKGKKFYFIQHYEVPQLWNEPTLWERAKKAESDPYRLPSDRKSVV